MKFKDQIVILLPEKVQQVLKKEKNEDKVVDILTNTLIANKHLANQFYNVFIAMDKDQAANIVEQAMKQGRPLEEHPPIQESQFQEKLGT